LRNKNLDILRAIAVVLVLGRHDGGHGPAFWKFVGWAGVDLFFVLSGFLISGLLFSEYKKTGGINWKRFFIRRGFKIYPAFYAMIFATFLWQIVKHQDIRWKPYLPEVFFYQSYQPDRLWGHTWSLAVEEHFYIFLPLLLLVILKFQRKGNSADPFRIIPSVWMVLAASCFLQRLFLAQTFADVRLSWASILFPTHLRLDGLFFGVLLGYLHHFHAPAMRQMTTRRSYRIVLFLASALLVSTCLFFPAESVFMLSFGLTALYLEFGGILVLILYSDPGELGRLPRWLKQSKLGDLAAYIGMYSYSIYLWHGMVSQHYQGLLQMVWPNLGVSALFWSYILTSLAAGIALSLLIEYPALHVRDRLFPSPERRRGDVSSSSPIQSIPGDLGLATITEHTREARGEEKWT